MDRSIRNPSSLFALSVQKLPLGNEQQLVSVAAHQGVDVKFAGMRSIADSLLVNAYFFRQPAFVFCKHRCCLVRLSQFATPLVASRLAESQQRG